MIQPLSQGLLSSHPSGLKLSTGTPTPEGLGTFDLLWSEINDHEMLNLE